MTDNDIREPIQKRSSETKDKIIKAGFDLICNDGYHNTDTAKIAKKAGVSTGIVYHYFKDKRDIFIAGLEKYADSIFYPMLNKPDFRFDKNNLSYLINKMIKKYISNHKLSLTAHEEITSMIHSDKDVAFYFYKREMEMTNTISNILVNNNFKIHNIEEKVHIIVGLVENLCHEIVYHKHSELDYNAMTNIITSEIVNLLTK